MSFQFFAKVSPILDAISILAIPLLLLIYENQQNEQQINFKQKAL